MPNADEIANAIRLLDELSRDPAAFAALPDDLRLPLLRAAGTLSRPAKAEQIVRAKALRKETRSAKTTAERSARAATGIRSARQAAVYQAPKQLSHGDATQGTAPSPGKLKAPRNCYICKAEYQTLHFFYDALCPECGDFNYAKRFQTASLEGQTALITGARVKIGYQACLMMLRAGARVIATTRFPVDAAMRYAREEDFAVWGHRLSVYGLDLRHTPSVELFCRHVEDYYGRLDILVNNAAQTVRRPPAFYAHLMAGETAGLTALPAPARGLLAAYHSCLNGLGMDSFPAATVEAALQSGWQGRLPGIGLAEPARLSQLPYVNEGFLPVETLFPQGRLDADLQQVDLRNSNSWRLKLGEISTPEMLELQLINAVAPFVLCNRLVGLMKRENTGCKHIVNVSAMEGKFFRFGNNGRHPHTNMAKAALNMLTHSSAADLAQSGIYMNAVDTGWVTDEDPAVLAARKQELHDFQPPLDIVDGAARVCDPFFDGINTGTHWCGAFLKDYRPIDW